MDIFEYLPQLIVAYDGDDEFANLIHVKKADKNKNYYCPCCGGIVKPRALENSKEQSHYYHKTGGCTKESQLHFFCKNWLFETGSKFYINDELFEVSSVEIEKSHYTPFGDYKPDITVYTTTDKIIYFEMFFTNRKTGDDYFCKWDALGNDVVEVDIKGYMFKTNIDVIPSFTYLYHDGVCYSKSYVKRDLYATTIVRIKHALTRQKVLNYKARIEQLDWFWQEVRKNTSENILKIVSEMEYDDMISCYEIIKRKQCVSYLKEDVLNIINQKVISEVRESLDLPKDENIYFDLRRVHGRTYKAGIRLIFKTEHIAYDRLFATCGDYWCDFNRIKTFPKVVFSKTVFSKNELSISGTERKKLHEVFNYVLEYKERLLKYENELCEYEKDNYKIRMKNDLYTVLIEENGKFELLFENRPIKHLGVEYLKREIDDTIYNKKDTLFLEKLFQSDEYISFMSFVKNQDDIDIRVDIQKSTWMMNNVIQFKMCICNKVFFNEQLEKNIDDFVAKKTKCELIVQEFVKSYYKLLDLVREMNNCKNNFWKVQFSFDHYGDVAIKIDQKLFIPKKHLTFEKVYLRDFHSLDKEDIVGSLKSGMYKVLENMQRCGYRVMEVRE